ncbi:hypothetical protein AM588_10011285 [Phytophthora nicotianae]|uniref:Uncharacterized protein n=1 Tax=Phytophthora nicotianae TaxID=4792 RepID=A0A0W8DS64_PHYNI|nr:hypothetical protein AM588_10011285 [Phytophthora nicotianae]
MDSKVWQRAAADLNPPNIASLLLRREFGGSRRQKTVRAIGEDKEENFWAESESAAKTTKSTISIAISPDGKTFASTHGDHTVKIICIETGKVIQTLVGHPRTPWSVKFHPTDPRYVASGCLGFQVRFWDIETGRCLYVSTLRHAIISISFHPSGDILAIASGTCVYTWDYQTLRSVTFLPDPSKIMVGEANERYVYETAYNGKLRATWLYFSILLATDFSVYYSETEFPVHRVTRIYRWEDMALLSHVESAMDDVNIALFSPICGGGSCMVPSKGNCEFVAPSAAISTTRRTVTSWTAHVVAITIKMLMVTTRMIWARKEMKMMMERTMMRMASTLMKRIWTMLMEKGVTTLIWMNIITYPTLLEFCMRLNCL